MTSEELRKLDAEIHEKVMGNAPREVRVRGSDKTVLVRNYPKHCADGQYTEHELRSTIFEVPRYSTDIAAAWFVVGKVRERFPHFSLQDFADGWECQFHNELEGVSTCANVADADTAPEAICLAALKVLA